MLVLIRGAGDIASGIALRLHRSGFAVAMTDLEKPTAIRRTVCFSEAIRLGQTQVEGVRAVFAADAAAALRILGGGDIAVLADGENRAARELAPDVLVDAILAKKNLGTRISDAPAVIGVGPGFTAGMDCHAVIETKRGHTLGRVIRAGAALPNTGIPGNIGGYAAERVLRAPVDGVLTRGLPIGSIVAAGQPCAFVGDAPMPARISGVLRGMLPDGTPVHAGMKSGDIDPRGDPAYCDTASDKALAVAGGALEAILSLTEVLKNA